MTAHSQITKAAIEAGLVPLRRADHHGPLRAMCKAEGYVMVRRPGAAPMVMAEADWLALPAQERAA